MSDISSQNTTIVTAQNVRFSADGQQLLKDISVRINSGNITMVLGHNGAGKTLLLSALHGLITPQHGNITGPSREKQKMVFQKLAVTGQSIWAVPRQSAPMPLHRGYIEFQSSQAGQIAIPKYI